MELKRLLTRADALLFQCAYQGAESLIEQAIEEADKIKSELAELDTLRTRVTEMAAEVERLQSVIDEANAQEPAWYKERGTLEILKPAAYNRRLDTGSINGFDYEPLYARPIPAQQSPTVAVPDGLHDLIAACRQIGFPVVSDGMRIVIDKMQSALRRVQNSVSQQSPRITEQDAREIIESFIGRYSITGYNEYVNGFMIHHCKALIDKLNGVTNAQ